MALCSISYEYFVSKTVYEFTRWYKCNIHLQIGSLLCYKGIIIMKTCDILCIISTWLLLLIFLLHLLNHDIFMWLSSVQIMFMFMCFTNVSTYVCVCCIKATYPSSCIHWFIHILRSVYCMYVRLSDSLFYLISWFSSYLIFGHDVTSRKLWNFMECASTFTIDNFEKRNKGEKL